MNLHCTVSIKKKLLLGSSILLFTPLLTHAAEWSIEPSVSLKEEYNDNIHLTTAPHSSVTTTTLSPSIQFNRATEISNISAGAKLNANKYTGEQGLDRVDQYYTFSSGYKTERSDWGLDASYIRDYASQNDPTAIGSLSLKQRSSASIRPSWQWSLSETNSLRLDYQFNRVKFETAQLNDYTNNTASASYIHNYSEKDQLTLKAYNSKFERTSGAVKSDTVGLVVGGVHKFSETLTGSLNVGGYRVKTTTEGGTVLCAQWVELPIFGRFCAKVFVTPTTETSQQGSSLDASLNKQFESASINAQLSRSLDPNGDGVLVESDKAGVTVSDNWTSLLTGSISASMVRSRYKDEALAANNSRYYTVSPSIHWRMSEWWSLDAGYRFAKYENDQSGLSAKSNAVFALIRYDWPKISTSR